jgi:hypothetical protein
LKNFRIVFGFSFWIVVILSVLLAPILLSENPWIQSLRGVSHYLRAERQYVTVNFDQNLNMKSGDPIFAVTENGLKRIGQILPASDNASLVAKFTPSARVVFFGDSPPITNDCYLTIHQSESSFEWAFQKLFPTARRQKVITELKATFELHQKEIVDEFSPIVFDTLQDVGRVLQEDLRHAFAQNREKLAGIAARYQEGFVEKRLIPLVKDEIWPIVEARSKPVLNEVGNEIWKRASLWRFGWRLAYDKFPLTDSNLLQKEWSRFVKNDAIPVLEEHADDFYALAKSIMKEISANPEVKLAGKDGIDQLLKDEEIKSLIKETLWNILFQNERLNQVFQDNFSNTRALAAIRSTSDKFEIKLREIGDQIFGTFEKGITREFAGILRNQILQRDQRWLILRYKDNSIKIENRFDLAIEIEGNFVRENDLIPEFVMAEVNP